MPELPEVETVRSGLAALLPGRSLHSIHCDWPKSFPQASDPRLPGRRFLAVRRRAKLLILDMDAGLSLLIHLKMTGQLVFVADSGGRFAAGHPNDSLVDSLPDRSTRVVFRLDTASLFFNDQRKFGWIELIQSAAVEQHPFVRRLGPEPLTDACSPEIFAQRLRLRPGTSVKAALLDQGLVSGVGNIYADEALWGAGIHPAERVGRLDDLAMGRIHHELLTVLRASIDQGGSTDRNYVDAEGRRGAYLDFARVFRRQGQACRRCGSSIEKIRVAGRGTHLCPGCQTLEVGE